MVNKKAFVRTLEAVIAILMIFGFILFTKPQLNPDAISGTPDQVKTAQQFIFSEISYNQDFRSCITTASNPSSGSCTEVCGARLDNFIRPNVPFGYDYACEICETSVSCMHRDLPLDRNIYADSIFIADKHSKILRIYFWQK